MEPSTTMHVHIHKEPGKGWIGELISTAPFPRVVYTLNPTSSWEAAGQQAAKAWRVLA